MRLTGKEIQRAINLGKSDSYVDAVKKDPGCWFEGGDFDPKYAIRIEPYDESQLNPNSYNLKLDRKLLEYCLPDEPTLPQVFDGFVLDPKEDNPVQEIEIPEGGYVLQPGKLYLGSTVEWTEAHGSIIPHITGRSSTGRLGLWVHVTAGFGDTGFCGNWTLELACIHPVRVYPGMEVCQISYEVALGRLTPYKGKYQGARSVESSKIHKDYK